MSSDPITESAKATQEVAKTAGKAIDAASGIEVFWQKIFGPSLLELGKMLEDTIRYRRGMRLLRLQRRFDEFRCQLNDSNDIQPIAMKVGVPLIEAASLEEDDLLQDMYAQLLVNATNTENCRKASHRSYVSILQDFGPVEAALLDALYYVPRALDAYSARTEMNASDNDYDEWYIITDDRILNELDTAIWNLHRLGCITTPRYMERCVAVI